MSVCVTPSWISRARKRRSSGSPQIVDERRRIDLAWVPIAMAIKPLPPRRINPSPAVVRGSPTSILLPPLAPRGSMGLRFGLECGCRTERPRTKVVPKLRKLLDRAVRPPSRRDSTGRRWFESTAAHHVSSRTS